MILDHQSFKDSFNHYIAVGTPKQKPIKDILMVGALFKDEKKDQLSINDNVDLMLFLREMKEYGISIDPNFSINVCNRHYGEDFLNDSYKVDAVLFSMVDNPIFYANPLKDNGYSKPFNISKNHFEKSIWGQKVIETGANILYIMPREEDRWNQAITFTDIQSDNFFKIKTGEKLYDLAVRKGFSCPLP